MNELLIALVYTALIFAGGWYTRSLHDFTIRRRATANLAYMEKAIAELEYKLAINPLGTARDHGQLVIIAKLDKYLQNLRKELE